MTRLKIQTARQCHNKLKVIQLAILASITIGLSGCLSERFRHERYICDSGISGISEVIINETKIGDDLKIMKNNREYFATIQKSNKNEIYAENKESKFQINRSNGLIKLLHGKDYLVINCNKTIFTM